MKKIFSYLKEEAATVIAITAIMAPLMLGMTGIGFDVGSWMMGKRDLQTAADAAAIAGAWEIVNNFDNDVDEVSLKEAENNGYIPANRGNIIVEVTNEDIGTVVTVQLFQEAPIYFSKVFVSEHVTLSSVASALIDVEPGNYCLLSLDPTADGAISTFGNVNIDSADCGMAVNSNSPTALDLGGNTDVLMADVSIVGDYTTGGSVDFDYDSMDTGATPAVDPYADLEIEPYGACDWNDFRAGLDAVDTNGDGVLELSEGVYCGGINFVAGGGGSNDYLLNPGTYILVDGDLNFGGFSGSLLGEGVTIILTYSDDSGDIGNFVFNGIGDIILTAPAEGDPYEGVVIYQDRDAEDCPGMGCVNTMTGDGGLVLQGAAYFPGRDVRFGGGSSQELAEASGLDVCTRIIGRTIQFSGNPAMGNDCEDVAVRDIEDLIVRLIF